MILGRWACVGTSVLELSRQGSSVTSSWNLATLGVMGMKLGILYVWYISAKFSSAHGVDANLP